jgi:hypothetical protein
VGGGEVQGWSYASLRIPKRHPSGVDSLASAHQRLFGIRSFLLALT